MPEIEAALVESDQELEDASAIINARGFSEVGNDFAAEYECESGRV